MTDSTDSIATLAEIQSRMTMDGFGYGRALGIRLTEAWHGGVRAELTVREDQKRPGGSVAGPVIMGLADAAMWGATMTVHPDGVQSVTSDLTLHFLRRPDGEILRCVATVLKPGRRLIVLRAELTCDDDPAVVAACQSTYAMPGTPIVQD